jgi:xanthine phosphoribosyltransferase
MVPAAVTILVVQLRTAIMERARVEGDLLLVDEFLNHRVEPVLMREVGAGLAALLGPFQPTMVLTAEASGIAPALETAQALGVPMVYAKKFVGTGNRYTFWREVVSPTKGTEYRVEVARRVLEPGLRVAVVDDFLSGGRTAEALGQITEEAGCDVAGFGFVISKEFMSGRHRLESHGWEVRALIEIKSLEDGRVVLA